MTRDVNLVSCCCNALSRKVLERERRFIGEFGRQTCLNGASKAGLSVGFAVFQQVADELVTRRKQFKKRQLQPGLASI